MDASKAARFRASSAKKTETYPFRFNLEQRRVLHLASEISGKSMQRIIEDHLWEALEGIYGHSVPVGSQADDPNTPTET